ncbi:hypothetical protein KKB43_06840 [Patescibacteria group bacterium]|nr:hypothetical protein [Patescibacteria group bacterium]MBU4580695.1 hypothetical protein [Patescibacteria group bacterium]
MNRNIFFLIVIFCVLLVAPTAYACDPLGCMFGGSKQDALILGEIMSESGDLRTVKVIFVFPENPAKALSEFVSLKNLGRTLKEGDQIVVTGLQRVVNLTDEEAKLITTGKKYLMSLNKKDDFYVPSWGIYEITGTTYENARLVETRFSDYSALQIFINSGGIEREFYFDGDTAFWRPSDGGEAVQIYPIINQAESKKIEDKIFQSVQRKKNIILYSQIIIVTLAIVGVSVFALRKKN